MFKKLALVGALLSATNAYAVDLFFSGSATSSCSVLVVQSGTLAADGSTAINTNPAAGGVAGEFQVDTNVAGAYAANAYAPSAFSTDPGLGFAPVISIYPEWTTGANGGAWTDNLGDGTQWTAELVAAGTTNGKMEFISNSPNGEAFPTGYYEAFATITCDPI